MDRNRRYCYQIMINWLMGLLLLCALSVDLSADIYRWVDENGRVQFGDRPPQDKSADEIIIKMTPASSTPSSLGESTPQQDRLEKQQQLLNKFRIEREESQQKAEEKKEKEAKRMRDCAYAKDNLKRYRSASGIYEPMPDGSKRKFSDAEIRNVIEQTQNEVERLCH